MPDIPRTANQQLPPEYRLPYVKAETVAQAESAGSDFDSNLHELTDTNIELATSIRTEATRQFPDDITQRKKAIGIALSALRLVQNQTIINTLNRHLALDVEPEAVNPSDMRIVFLPPAANP